MAGKIARGWEITKLSWSVLMDDKKLLVFPLISSAACLAILATFAVPVALLVDWSSMNEEKFNAAYRTPWYYLGLFAFYFANYMIVFFFNSALTACVFERFRGGQPTIQFGLSQAIQRLPQIAMWALVSATVGLVLQMIVERSRLIGGLVARLLGAGWTIATYFAVPVIVVEKAQPKEVFKRSLSLLTRSWGESLVANIGMGLATGLAVLVATLPLIGGIVGIVSESIPVGFGIALIALTVLLWLGITLVSSTMKIILTTALYQFASTGTAPGPFNDDLFRTAFKAKK